MRFGTRDLIWMTTGVSIYSAVLGAYYARGGVRFELASITANLGSTLWMLWLVGSVLIENTRALAGQQSASRTAALSVRYPRGRLGHLFVLGCFLLLTVPFLSNPNVELSWQFLPFCLATHCFIEASSVIYLSSRGVSHAGKLYAWGDNLITLKLSPARLVCWQDPNTERMAPMVIKVPESAAEEVQAYLAARKSAGEDRPS